MSTSTNQLTSEFCDKLDERKSPPKKAIGNENHINLSDTSEKHKKTEKTSININKRPKQGQNGEKRENKRINAFIGLLRAVLAGNYSWPENCSDPILRCIHMYGKFTIGIGDIELACINNGALHLFKVLVHEGGAVNEVVLSPDFVSSLAKAVGGRLATLTFASQTLH